PEVAIHLNLSPDHLDRHGNLESYGRAKLAIFRNQVPGDVAVLNADDAETGRLNPPGEASLLRFSAAGLPDVEITLAGDEIRVDGKTPIETSELQVLGSHNVANAMA